MVNLLRESINISAGRSNSDIIGHINKFGYNPAIGGSYEPITDLGTNVLPTAAGVVSVVSSSGNDDGSSAPGTGARTVEIQGLDANYEPLTSIVTLEGSTPVTTGSDEFLRIFRMRVLTAGTGETNAGNITASISSQNVARISAGAGQTLMAVYTVPAGRYAYLVKYDISVSKNTDATVQLRVREEGGAWQVKSQAGTYASSFEYTFAVPLQILPKSDIQIQAKSGGTQEVGAMFDLLFEKV